MALTDALALTGGPAYVIAMMWRLAIAGVLAAALAACAARPTPYQPRNGDYEYGYAETQIDGQTWRVEFAGNFDTPRVTVENYLLYRSAEIMLFGGYERFIVLEKEVERTRDIRGYTPYPYYGWAGFGHRHSRRHSHLGSRYGYGAHHTYALDTYRAVATIRTFAETAAPQGLQVYAARDVIAQLGKSVVLPK